MSQNATLRPDYYEKCSFTDMWVYKRRIDEDKVDTIVVTESISFTRANPMQIADFSFAAATTETHHTFVGRVEHYSGFFMN